MIVVNVITATVNVRDLQVIKIGEELVEVDGLGLFNDGDIERGMDTSISGRMHKAQSYGTESHKRFNRFANPNISRHSVYYLLTKQ